jgi:outer membrane lipopolysaccharide assembly protein LptE/RlpB
LRNEIQRRETLSQGMRGGVLAGCVLHVSLTLCVGASLLLVGCGYHVAGNTSQLLPGIRVIAVPSFENRTNRYRVEQPLTEAVIHEFLASTRYHIVSTDKSADAVLRGEILSLESSALLYDTQTNTTTNTTIARATTMLVTVRFRVTLEDKATQKILYQNNNYVFRQPYEISTDPTTFFDEQGPALDRMYRDFASRLVSDIVERF